MINRLFWKGIIVVVPVGLSVYIFLIILSKAENFFGSIIKKMLGTHLYVPGFGLILSFLAMIIVGILVSNFLTGSVIKLLIRQFEKVPIIKTIYNPLRDLLALFGGSSANNMKKVVLVPMSHTDGQCLGLVTREEFDDLSTSQIDPSKVAVYIPLSYMLGGITVLVDRDKVVEVDIPVEKAIKLAITGWIKSDQDSTF